MDTRRELKVYASHSQFSLEDAEPPDDIPTDTDVWDGAALERHLGVAPGVVAVGTGSDDFVPVTVEILRSEPADDSNAHDHVTEASLRVTSQAILVTELFSEPVDEIAVEPGQYRVRIAYDGLDHAGVDPPGDKYRVQIWPAEAAEPRVLKWYDGWQPKPPPVHPGGLRILAGAAAWDTKNQMSVIGWRAAEREGVPDYKIFLYHDRRDDSYWEYSYDSTPPYETILSEVDREHIKGKYQLYPSRSGQAITEARTERVT